MYVIPDVPLVAQQRTRSGWYASAQMLIQWRRNRAGATLVDHPDPSELDWTRSLEAADRGLPYAEVLELARVLGLKVIPPMSISVGGIESLLVRHGPLWAQGIDHATVFAGVNGETDEVFVHDPRPPGIGVKEWRSYSGWFIQGDAAGSRATSPLVQASFLHHP